jgi:hypothetical protein
MTSIAIKGGTSPRREGRNGIGLILAWLILNCPAQPLRRQLASFETRSGFAVALLRMTGIVDGITEGPSS